MCLTVVLSVELRLWALHLCNEAVLSFFAKPGVSKLCTLSMRHRPYSLIFTVSWLLICLFASTCEGHHGVCYFQLYSWEMMLNHVGLTVSVLSWWGGREIHGFGEHHFYWLAGVCNTEWNKGSKPGVVSCLLWKADELSSASLGAFHWLLLWLMQAASAKIAPFCLPLLSSDMCSVRGLLTCLCFMIWLLSCLPEWHCGGAKVAVKELMLWVWIYNIEELQRPVGWTVRIMQC